MCDWSFFFSSRRRHTRWPRDWSSDVCSSDLTHSTPLHYPDGRAHSGSASITVMTDVPNGQYQSLPASAFITVASASYQRSEERRVGKECRSRWWADQVNKKILIVSGAR